MNQHAFTPEEKAAVYRAIYERRDIRSFLPDPIEEEVPLQIQGCLDNSVSRMKPPDDFQIFRFRFQISLLLL
ncbi:hypothetical protein [Effusibacillus dendaii]|uniref:Nitroreductase domain-containing protein n=1 Tax=Effusibacillus dendaii TaxID=2743772 RepID=A0A7I8D7W4_9BACL|nr:hypothetical protein [Effusibacillus dendaii]BCJ86107.1 hypothetical protein skT53_10920 [Effusibacillus dendaii]